MIERGNENPHRGGRYGKTLLLLLFGTSAMFSGSVSCYSHCIVHIRNHPLLHKLLNSSYSLHPDIIDNQRSNTNTHYPFHVFLQSLRWKGCTHHFLSSGKDAHRYFWSEWSVIFFSSRLFDITVQGGTNTDCSITVLLHSHSTPVFLNIASLMSPAYIISSLWKNPGSDEERNRPVTDRTSDRLSNNI